MKEKLPFWIFEAERDLPDSNGSQWGYIKHKIGELSREFGGTLKKAKTLIKNNIEKELSQLSQNLDETNKKRYQNLKLQLDEIIENEVKGSILRSLCQDYEQWEKCSKYFFSLEKLKCRQKTISNQKPFQIKRIS